VVLPEIITCLLKSVTGSKSVAILGFLNHASNTLIQNITEIFRKRLTIHGYIVPDLIPQFASRFFAEIPPLLAQGKIKCEEYIVEGIENTPQVLIDSLRGYDGIGKPVVLVAKD
jgi:NADPH-dependent curcumin reductase CurA